MSQEKDSAGQSFVARGPPACFGQPRAASARTTAPPSSLSYEARPYCFARRRQRRAKLRENLWQGNASWPAGHLRASASPGPLQAISAARHTDRREELSWPRASHNRAYDHFFWLRLCEPCSSLQALARRRKTPPSSWIQRRGKVNSLAGLSSRRRDSMLCRPRFGLALSSIQTSHRTRFGPSLRSIHRTRFGQQPPFCTLIAP